MTKMDTADNYIRHRVYVDVLATDLWVAEDQVGELYFPIRATCGSLELDSTTALETIKADSRLFPGLRAIRLPTPPRGEREVQCLRSDEYTWWLALIDPRRFKPDRRTLLEERQRVLMRLQRKSCSSAWNSRCYRNSARINLIMSRALADLRVTSDACAVGLLYTSPLMDLVGISI